MQTTSTSKKVILTGSFAVGKTSLFNRFIYNQFDDRYLTTIGVKVNKRVVQIEDKEVSILLWDIAGEISQDKVPITYFLSTSGLIYVFDLTRPSTYANLESDIAFLQNKVPGAIIKIVANKCDLVSAEELATILAKLAIPPTIITSAKNGDNVEALFESMARELAS
jgi:small GTP-binding protein